jgi:putative ABC transport system permease protein
MIADLWQDLRYGARMLLKQPGFTLLAMLTLALGIGSTTTIFSAIQNILLNPFPYKDAGRIVTIRIQDTSSSASRGRGPLTHEFLDYQEQNHVFEDVMGATGSDVLYNSGAGVEQFSGCYVTPNTFNFLGVPAELGRGVMPDDARPDAPPVFVMAHKLWVKRFNLDPTILGKTFMLNGTPATLVGIMPPRFTFYFADLWIARTIERGDPRANRDSWYLQAKLKPGVTIQQAQADIEVIARRLAQVYPDDYPRNFIVRVVGFVDDIVGPFRKTLYTIAAAVGLLFLIACSNVANMLLARATAREKEMAIRSALGARRMRLVGQLLAESLLLALGGAIVGCLFSYAGVKGLAALIPEDGLIPSEVELRLNFQALLFSLATAAGSAALFGLAPALQTVRKDLVEPLKDAGKGAGGGFQRGRMRNALVVFEVALSLVLLSGAGLLMRSFVKLQRMDLGFNAENLLYARLPFPRGQYESAAEKQRFYEQLLPRLRALPGVAAATETTTLPPFGGVGSDIDIVGKTRVEKWRAIISLCSEGYFPTLQLRTTLGRTLSDLEVNSARKVAVVNQTFVNKFLGNDYPIGQRVKINLLESMPDSPVKDPVFEVIGVIADVKNQGVRESPMPEMFVPSTITGAFNRGVLVRTSTPSLSLLNNMQREIWSLDSNVALTTTGSLENLLKQYSYAAPRFGLVLMGVFASVGLALAAMGVFSVIAYTVSQRTYEIGVRMALGAQAADVVWLVLRTGLKMVGLGVGLGLLASFALTQVIASQLWEVSPRDPVTLASAMVVTALAGLAACYFPARRATQVDPLTALRYE